MTDFFLCSNWMMFTKTLNPWIPVVRTWRVDWRYFNSFFCFSVFWVFWSYILKTKTFVCCFFKLSVSKRTDARSDQPNDKAANWKVSSSLSWLNFVKEFRICSVFDFCLGFYANRIVTFGFWPLIGIWQLNVNWTIVAWIILVVLFCKLYKYVSSQNLQLRSVVADAFLAKFQLKPEELQTLRGTRDGVLHPVGIYLTFCARYFELSEKIVLVVLFYWFSILFR